MSFPETPSILSKQLREPRTLAVVTCRRNLTLQKPISDYARAATVVIGIPFKNSAKTLRRSIESALTQELSEGHCAIVILDDQSTDAWMNEVGDLLRHPAMIHVTGHCGTPAQARNAVLDFIETALPQVRWVARLDADDCLSSAGAVEALRSEGENKDALFVVGSNDLVSSGEVQDSPNIAIHDVLLNPSRVVGFIHAFWTGQSRHELPSCNLLLRSGRGIRYPLLRSAEDHWLVAQLLVFKSERAAIVPTPLYCRYTLKGNSTSANTRSGAHKKTRNKLGRLGIDIHATAGKGDVGFCGNWTLEISVKQAVKVYKGMPIGQLIYFPANGEIEIAYNKKKNSKYSNQPDRPIESMMWKNKF